MADLKEYLHVFVWKKDGSFEVCRKCKVVKGTQSSDVCYTEEASPVDDSRIMLGCVECGEVFDDIGLAYAHQWEHTDTLNEDMVRWNLGTEEDLM